MNLRNPMIGVVHVPAMPGDPGAALSFSGAFDFAFNDAKALVEGGVDAIIVENFGGAPFAKGSTGSRIAPHEAALLARITSACKDRWSGLKIGVNCLRNDAYTAMGIAAACELDFIRVNIHSGAYVTDQGLIEGEAHHTLRYRHAVAPHVEIWADVLVKHATPLAPLTLTQAAEDCVLRAKADALILSGDGTGKPLDPDALEEVCGLDLDVPIVVGSGLSPDNVEALGARADLAIVGSYLKHGGILSHPVDAARVKEMTALVSEHFQK